jgi:GAF domain-containing protein
MSDAVKSRSVLDYDTEDALRKALLAVELNKEYPENDSNEYENQQHHHHHHQPNQSLDWVLPCYDPETTEIQSMKQELRRLQVLKSYVVLDSDREQSFERITAIAARVYDVPIALVSLVDLGRQWFLSNRGLGDCRETPRRLAFCAHAVCAKQNECLIVPDATRDFRFQDNPLVTGPPNIRFYAGAPLISPEGFKLGTLCIISDQVRPDGLSADEQQTLLDMAEQVVEAMVHRRRELQRQEKPEQLIAYTGTEI